MISVGIFGVKGYMGNELLRILANHKEAKIAWLAGRRKENYSCPKFMQHEFNIIDQEHVFPCDVAFLALPTAVTLQVAPKLLHMGIRLIDLSACFRLDDKAVWESIYGMQHSAWQWQKNSVYGINEINTAKIADSNLVANPGCFSSSVILALAPLMQQGLISADIAVTGLSGTSGMGRESSPISHHNEMCNNLMAYNVIKHRHTYEIEQELGKLTDQPVTIHFTPVYVPINRGILSVCRTLLKQRISRRELLQLYEEFYASHPFLHINQLKHEPGVEWQTRPYPWVNSVAGTNYASIGLEVDEDRQGLVILCALDNLGKGGAQVAVENMNIMFDLARESGLEGLSALP